ncbi:MAG TPA: NAD(P)-dependent oxidoreductase [Tepidisphaeraceae bacterium]|jgi:D-3-phosphoglycerate dehydrogenase|nr:NAD(P)-dependent oxidoreductase [Tepidisphaeraceae bacterium]
MPDRPIVLVTEGGDKAPMDWLHSQADVLEIPLGDPRLDDALSRAQGLVVRTYTKVNDDLLSKAPNLKVVGRGGVGLENIDVSACRRRNIQVVYTPDANTLAVGDFIFGCILQLIRPYAAFRDRTPDPKEFKRLRDTLRGRQLNELTLGILGMGRVGRRVGHIAANGFGMRVIYNDLLDVSSQVHFAATPVDKPTLYRESDILSLHVTMLPGNENLIGPRELALMKPTSILINTSRGEVLDASALADALKNKKLSAAALDVFHPEPPPPNFPLLGLDNVILTPHMAARTYSAIENMSWVVRDLIAVLHGQNPQFPAP